MTIRWIEAPPPQKGGVGADEGPRSYSNEMHALYEAREEQELLAWQEVMAESGLKQDTFEDGTPWTEEELNNASAHGMRTLFLNEGHK